MTRDEQIEQLLLAQDVRAYGTREQLTQLVDRWLDTGFEPDEVQGWLAAHVWTPEVARRLADTGHTTR